VKFMPMPIVGAFVIEIEPIEDTRGFFARTYCEREFVDHGLPSRFVQCNSSLTRKRGTLRGMHLQAPPHEEAKLIRCTSGGVYDVTLDLRPSSATFMKWHAVELDAVRRNAVYIPEGCAHGFQTLRDESELQYSMSAQYEPDASRGVRWNDEAFKIRWPIDNPILSPADLALARFEREKWIRQYR